MGQPRPPRRHDADVVRDRDRHWLGSWVGGGAMNTGRGPAFPVQALASPGSEIAWGMSLRDWFAGQALAGLMAGYQSGPMGIYACAQVAIETADAMLRARELGQEGEQGGEKVPSEELPDEHWHKIQTRPSLSWHPARGWEAACELRGTMMYGRGKTIAQAQAALRAEWEGGAQ